jgi:hypothetical protein
MDYMNHTRLKIQGMATLIRIADADPDLVSQLDQRAAPAERVLQIEVIAMDWNCPKYIPTLYSEAASRRVRVRGITYRERRLARGGIPTDGT